MKLLCDAHDVELNAIGTNDRRLSMQTHAYTHTPHLWWNFPFFLRSLQIPIVHYWWLVWWCKTQEKLQITWIRSLASMHIEMSEGRVELTLSSNAVENRRFSEINVVRILFSFFLCVPSKGSYCRWTTKRTSRRSPGKGQRAYWFSAHIQMCARRTCSMLINVLSVLLAASIWMRERERNFHFVEIVIHESMNNNNNLFFHFRSIFISRLLPSLSLSIAFLLALHLLRKFTRRTNASRHIQICMNHTKKWVFSLNKISVMLCSSERCQHISGRIHS